MEKYLILKYDTRTKMECAKAHRKSLCRAIEDRFNNVYLFTNPTTSTQSITYVDCTNDVTYFIVKTGIYATVSDVTTQINGY